MLRRISPLADNPPEPWRRRVFHGGTTDFARGAPFYRGMREERRDHAPIFGAWGKDCLDVPEV